MNNIKTSLSLKIAVAYILLALVNLIFFSVIIVENQTDLIVTSFKHQAEALAKTALGSLSRLKIGKVKDSEYEALKQNLKVYDLNWYRVYNRDGVLWHQYQEAANSPKEGAKRSQKKILQKIQELNSTASLFRTRYLVELQKENFSIELLLLLGEDTASRTFLSASLNLKSMEERLLVVYYQMIAAVVWGIVFHVLFAVFLIRLILRRIALLARVSLKMKAGDLSSRALWKMNAKSQDELDLLGLSFNSMADSVQEKMETISGLNKQIQKELKIGKEVQQLLLSVPEEVIKDFKPQVYSRPLREVSGDMYYYFKLMNGHRGVFFADASGHGVPAALITAISFLSLENILNRSVEKEALMNILNESITRRMQQAFYLTAVFLIFDGQGQLWTINAGHNPFFILPRGGPGIEIPSTGLPIGVLPDSKYSLQSYKVEGGDKIFIYSDGLIETRNRQNEEFGLERLQAILREHRTTPIENMATEVQRRFEEFAYNSNDDVTFLALEIP